MKRTFFIRWIIYVGPLLLWMGFIFFVSTNRGSAENTTSTLNSILTRLSPGVVRYLSLAQISRVDWNIRKTAHITEYALLGILAFRAYAFGNPRFRSRVLILTLLTGIFYAASDEYHQSFVPSRGAAAADVFFDTFGVLSGLVICLWQHIVKQTSQAKPAFKTK